MKNDIKLNLIFYSVETGPENRSEIHLQGELAGFEWRSMLPVKLFLLFWWDLQQFETLPFSLAGNSLIQIHLIPRSSNVDLFTSILLNSCSKSIKADRSMNIPWGKSYLIIAPENTFSSSVHLISISSQKF